MSNETKQSAKMRLHISLMRPSGYSMGRYKQTAFLTVTVQELGWKAIVKSVMRHFEPAFKRQFDPTSGVHQGWTVDRLKEVDQ